MTSVPRLTSSLLAGVPGVVHGFTTREGGVSTGAFTSLNLGLGKGDGDSLASIHANHARLAAATGFTLRTVQQVHGVHIQDVTNATPTTEADGMVCSSQGMGALILVADCAPVLLARRDGQAVAAVHAGWRGAVHRIASLALKHLGTTDVVAAVGPCIGPCCFEVGPEVLKAAMDVAGPAAQAQGAWKKPHVDLAQVVVEDLVAAGVARANVDVLRHCTVCDPRFFSFRRDWGVTGRQGGFVGCQRL